MQLGALDLLVDEGRKTIADGHHRQAQLRFTGMPARPAQERAALGDGM
jgi:hypothetical protein